MWIIWCHKINKWYFLISYGKGRTDIFFEYIFTLQIYIITPLCHIKQLLVKYWGKHSKFTLDIQTIHAKIPQIQ